MLISETIAELEKIKDEYGDIPLLVQAYQCASVESIGVGIYEDAIKRPKQVTNFHVALIRLGELLCF